DFLPADVTTTPKGDRISFWRDGIELLTPDTIIMPDMDKQIADMDAGGVDIAVNSISSIQEFCTMKMAKVVNDGMAEAQRGHPDRVWGLIHVPPFEDGALEEVERGAKDLALKGVCVTTHTQGKYLDAEEYMPLFHKAHDLGLPIVVHAATIPADYKRTLEAYDLARSMGRVLDHTLATIRLIFSDHLRELPNLKFFQGHLGGAMFILRGRFDPSYKTHWNPAEVEYDKYIDQMYFDTAPPFWYKAEVRCAIDTLGADHICYGSDYPIQPDWIERSLDLITGQEDLDDDALADILGRNALRGFGVID
ncbi:MAG: amidohydrolase family protein, partial [Nitrospinota bacterium]|nr:amidohydrolase family protein [Nitrospinota bacterium]